MNKTIEISKLIDKYLPADGVGTERERIRMEMHNDITLLIKNIKMKTKISQEFKTTLRKIIQLLETTLIDDGDQLLMINKEDIPELAESIVKLFPTDESIIIMYALNKRGCINNGNESRRSGVVYKMGWLLRKEQEKYGQYKGLHFKDSSIYHCGDGDWESTPSEISADEVREHIDYYFDECGGDIFNQWGI